MIFYITVINITKCARGAYFHERRSLNNGWVETDNNIGENALRSVAVGRK
ncbi:transposase, partial [Salmonella enterica subsp. enterica serovar Newport]|nr:transposase [Salmonella enterica subsp. enterica serovar Newport]